MQRGGRSRKYKFRVWSTSGGTAPAPVLVKADEVFDGLKERDDGRGPETNGDPLVDETRGALRASACVNGDDPNMGKHQNVNNDESCGVENDCGNVAEADPTRLGKIDTCADDCR